VAARPCRALDRSATISQCAGAIDCRGEGRSSRSTSTAFQMKTRVPASTLSDSACSGHSPESEGTQPGIVVSPLGTHSVMSWAKDSSGAARMINARSETAATKPAFRDALKSRRCLIPADAFYEWKKIGITKQPYCFEVAEGELFAFAGIWDLWRDGNCHAVETCSILTTTPNALTSAVHDRMPVIFDPDGYDLWLDPGMKDVAAASDVLKPCDARLMRCYPISTRHRSLLGLQIAEVLNLNRSFSSFLPKFRND